MQLGNKRLEEILSEIRSSLISRPPCCCICCICYGIVSHMWKKQWVMGHGKHFTLASFFVLRCQNNFARFYNCSNISVFHIFVSQRNVKIQIIIFLQRVKEGADSAGRFVHQPLLSQIDRDWKLLKTDSARRHHKLHQHLHYIIIPRIISLIIIKILSSPKYHTM